MSFTEKPPMLRGSPQEQINAIRDYLFRMVGSLDDAITANSTGSVGRQITRADGTKIYVPDGKDEASIELVRKNAQELRSLIIKSAKNLQSQIDDIELATFYVKYADNFQGEYPVSMYNSPTANTYYMGVCYSTDASAPTNPALYTWSRIKGNDGAPGSDGSPGAPGTDGRTPYLHIKYSNDGQTFTPNQGEDMGTWIGMYTDFTQADSTTFSDYEWHRFADDTELQSMIAAGDAAVISYVDSKTEVYDERYVAISEYGTFTENIDARIETTARGVVDSYHYGSSIQSMQDSIGLIQNYFTTVSGEIRRGIIEDPDTGEYVTGIAISQSLTFSGECGPDDANNPGDGNTYYYLTQGQTFGLYTSTGWQFWIDGQKKGWFDSLDGMLHVANIVVEDTLNFGGHWRMRATGSAGRIFELFYLGG